MMLAGFEWRDGGLFRTVMELDRKMGRRRYRLISHGLSEVQELEAALRATLEDPVLCERKKQFSQMGRPPKWMERPPILMLRWHSEEMPIVSDGLVDGVFSEIPMEGCRVWSPPRGAGDAALMLVLSEGRFAGRIPEEARGMLCLLIWYCENVKRPVVRYGSGRRTDGEALAS